MASASSTIAEQVAELHAKRAQSSAEEISRAREEALARDILPDGIQAVGCVFPDGDLADAEGKAVKLRAVLGGRPAIVVFYRGAWCPYCNLTLHTYQERLFPVLAERGVGMVAISPQNPDESMTLKEKHDLQFPVLSDPDNRIAGAMGILNQPMKEGAPIVPMPTVALVDAEGTLVWIDVHKEHTIRTEVAQILDAVDRLIGVDPESTRVQ